MARQSDKAIVPIQDELVQQHFPEKGDMDRPTAYRVVWIESALLQIASECANSRGALVSKKDYCGPDDRAV